MRELEGRHLVVAFWTLLAAAVVITLASVVGNLKPGLLPPDVLDIFGLLALGLVFGAHVLPPIAALFHILRTLAPLRPAANEPDQFAAPAAGRTVSFQARSSLK